MNTIKEGFWYSDSEENRNYPMPIAKDKPWSGRGQFLDKLKFVESLAERPHPVITQFMFMGHSKCRICGCVNGSTEYHTRDGWEWPSGYRHYIEVHNVEPSEAFKKYIKHHF